MPRAPHLPRQHPPLRISLRAKPLPPSKFLHLPAPRQPPQQLQRRPWFHRRQTQRGQAIVRPLTLPHHQAQRHPRHPVTHFRGLAIPALQPQARLQIPEAAHLGRPNSTQPSFLASQILRVLLYLHQQCLAMHHHSQSRRVTPPRAHSRRGEIHTHNLRSRPRRHLTRL